MAGLQWEARFYRNRMDTTWAYTGHYNDQPVVIKHSRFFTSNDLQKACERAEAQSRLVDDGIVRLLTYFLQTDNEDYRLTTVLDCMRTDLESELSLRSTRGCHWTEEQIWWYIWTLVHGLAYAQEQQVCHRNIQPDNLFFSSGDLMKISNFGKAKVSDITVSVQMTDIPYYASPELKASLMTHNEICDFNPYQSDVYSLGVVLLQMTKLSKSPELCSWAVSDTLTTEPISTLYASDALKSLLSEMLKVQSRMDFLQLRGYIEGLCKAEASPEPSLPELNGGSSVTPDGNVDPEFIKWMLHVDTEVQAGLEEAFRHNIALKFICSIENICVVCEKPFTTDITRVKDEESLNICGEVCRNQAIRCEKTISKMQEEGVEVRQQPKPKARKLTSAQMKLKLRLPVRSRPPAPKVPPSKASNRKPKFPA
jgi:serine/threonine protein kinase